MINPTEDHRPKIIRWQLTPSQSNTFANDTPISDDNHKNLTTQECLLVIDSITRLSKSIVVLTGPNLLQRNDLYSVVEYGVALGLKMILEVTPEQLTDEVLQQYHRFGPKVFRIVVDECIVEDMEARYVQSTKFHSLALCIFRLRKAGYEIHLGLTVKHPDSRALAFYHDYAFRSNADGLYCHLAFDRNGSSNGKENNIQTDTFIHSIATMKECSPKRMYVSPQCVKFHFVGNNYTAASEESRNGNTRWTHCCLAGKSFTFIDETGTVFLCGGNRNEIGRLRDVDYNLSKVWNMSEVFQYLRSQQCSCSETSKVMKTFKTNKHVHS